MTRTSRARRAWDASAGPHGGNCWPRVSPLRIAPALHSAANADAWLFWLFWSLPVVAAATLAVRARHRARTMARRTPARRRAHPRCGIRECRFSPRHPSHPLLRRHRAAGAPRRVAAWPVLGRTVGAAFVAARGPDPDRGRAHHHRRGHYDDRGNWRTPRADRHQRRPAGPHGRARAPCRICWPARIARRSRRRAARRRR